MIFCFVEIELALLLFVIYFTIFMTMGYQDHSKYMSVEYKIVYRVLLLFKVTNHTLLLSKSTPKQFFYLRKTNKRL